MRNGTSAADVAVIGLGAIGLPICVNASAAGFRVQGWNRSPGPRRQAIDAGAVVPETLDKIDAPIILSVLPDIPQLFDVLDSGLESVLQEGDVLVVVSTAAPSSMHILAERLAILGVSVIDAPVSGGDVGAWEGTLSIMVGGESDDLAKCLGVLQAISHRIEHLGPLGSGQLAKTCNQMIVGATLAAIGEALTLGRAAGLDSRQLLDALGAGMAGSRAMEIKRSKYLNSDYTPGGSVANQLKDLRIALDSAESLGFIPRLTSIVTEEYQKLVSSGESGLDHSAIILLAERARIKEGS
jgi:2-hydroxy-3-oxopropionate reductase